MVHSNLEAEHARKNGFALGEGVIHDKAKAIPRSTHSLGHISNTTEKR